MMQYRKIALLSLLLTTLLPTIALAHQPRLVQSSAINVLDPEISKAYYGQLTGKPHVYTTQKDTPFELYVNVLVPDIPGQTNNVSATIEKNGTQIATLDGTTFSWKSFHEPFGYDDYLQGPEYKARAEAGTYTITVSSSNNDSKYSLAIGEAEKFDFTDTANALTLIPELKRDFFNESPITFILSPLGFGMIIILYICAGIAGLLYRFTLKSFAKNRIRGAHKNIGTTDRLLRFGIGIGLLLLAITTTWSPTLIFFSGFALFEALFSWCGFYAALGKSTCPLK